MPGLVFTYVWALEELADKDMVCSYVEIVESRRGQVHFVELAATQEERPVRNSSDFRLEHKRSKRDLDFSRNNLLELDENYVMNTGGRRTVAQDLFEGRGYLKVDNTDVPAADVADQILSAFKLS